MLNVGDIEFMKESQGDIYELRQRPITLISRVEIFDDFTGQLIGEDEVEYPTLAVITEITTRSKDGARYLEDGIEYEQGDIKIDVKLDYLEDMAGKVIRAEFDDKKYEVLGGDKKGIGVRNRVEFIGREIA